MRTSGKIVLEARRERRMTQRQLASRAGVSNAMISYWESGKEVPGKELVEKICDILGIDFEGEMDSVWRRDKFRHKTTMLRRRYGNIVIEDQSDKNRPLPTTIHDKYRQRVYEQSGVWLEDVILVPVVGSIPASGSVGVEELHIGAEEYEYIPAAAVPEAKGIFGLRVSGNSMLINDIREKDIIIVDTVIERQNGDIVLLSVNSQVMLRRMHCFEDHCVFQAEHKEPVFCKAEMRNEVIIGKVIRVIKEK